MERNSFKEYSVLAMVSKEEQRPMKACSNFFFHLDRVIAYPASRVSFDLPRQIGKRKETLRAASRFFDPPPIRENG